MSLKNTSESYGTLTLILHWLMAVMIMMLTMSVAALKHHFLKQDNTLGRMLGRK